MAVSNPSTSNSPYDRRKSNSILISYAREDEETAKRLYTRLDNEGFSPWLDKENILPGQNWEDEIRKAIKSCRYIIILFSNSSIEKISFIHKEIKDAILEQKNFSPSSVFIVPVRLDECNIPYNELAHIQYVDLFPNWNLGLNKVIQTLKMFTSNSSTYLDSQKNISDLKEKIVDTVTNLESVLISNKVIEPFKDEKRFFVGRGEYINKKIKELLHPGSRVCIVGPGGSGKSQLAFKSLHQYCEKEKIVDMVIPVYFAAGSGLMSFDQFLLKLGNGLNRYAQVLERMNLDEKKSHVYGILANKRHPLIYLDNYESVSLSINDESEQPHKDAVDISDFLNNRLPQNTSILVTSREMNNNLDNEKIVLLEGLDREESYQMFITRVDDKSLQDLTNPKIKKAIDDVIEMTGGHPLSLEIISRNIKSVEEINEITFHSKIKKVNRNEPNERLKSLNASLDYTMNKLGFHLRQLLKNLMIFRSPFPISAAVEILGATKNDIIDLYKRSLITRITVDNIYGPIQDMDYWVYTFHPATRNYLRDKENDYFDLRDEFGKKYLRYHYDLLVSIYKTIGQDTQRNAIAQYNILTQDPENDFENSITTLQIDNTSNENLQKSGYLLSYLGLISNHMGYYAKASDYYKRSLDIYNSLNDRVGMSKDYKNIGRAYYGMGDYTKALDYHKKALNIDDSLNDRSSRSSDYTCIGLAYDNMGDYTKALDYHKKALNIDDSLNDRVGMARTHYNISFPLYKMNERSKALTQLTIGQNILIEFREQAGYSHPLLKDIESRINLIKQE